MPSFPIAPRKYFAVPFGLYLLFLALSPGWFLSHDAATRLIISRQLWSHGSLFIQDARPERFLHTAQGYTSYFGIGQTLLFIPFDILGKLLGSLANWNVHWKTQVQMIPFLIFYAPLTGMAWWWAARRTGEALGLTSREAVLGATLFSTCTIALVYISQSLQEEAVVGALLLTSFFFLIRWTQDFSTIDARKVGLFAGTALLFRLNVVFAFLPLLGFVLDRVFRSQTMDRKIFLRGLLHCLLGFSGPIFLLLLFNYLRFGNPLHTGYDLAYRQLQALGVQPWRNIQPKIAWDLLFGIGKGLFVLSPPLILALIGIAMDLRNRPGLWIGFGLSLVLSVLFHSKLNGFACGGHCWGGRFQIHLIGFLVYPLVLGIKVLWKNRVGRAEVVFFLLLGLGIQSLACLAPESLEYIEEIASHGDYNERLITGYSDGQLLARVANVRDWLQEEFVHPESAKPGIWTGFRKNFMPNLWGPAYAKQLAPGPAQSLLYFAWIFELFLGLGLIVSGLLNSELAKEFQGESVPNTEWPNTIPELSIPSVP